MRTGNILFLAAIFAVVSCGGNKNGKSAVRFTPPVVPSVLSEENSTGEYLLKHWFEGWSADLDSLEAEKAFSNWVVIASGLPGPEAASGLIPYMGKDSIRLHRFAERYFYNPNSPFRDEDIYGAIAAHCGLEKTAELCRLNAAGTPAADFAFETSKGKSGNLYGIEAEYTLLMFSNPGCNACKDIINALMGDPTSAEAIMSGQIAVLSMYIDEDLDLWREHLADYPRIFTCAFDPTYTLRDNNLYHIRAIPSLYLLDDRKTVLLKDTTIERLLEYIYRF